MRVFCEIDGLGRCTGFQSAAARDDDELFECPFHPLDDYNGCADDERTDRWPNSSHAREIPEECRGLD